MESVAIPQKLKRVIHALRQARSGITLMNRNRRGSKLNTARWQHIESMEQRQLLTNLVKKIKGRKSKEKIKGVGKSKGSGVFDLEVKEEQMRLIKYETKRTDIL